VEDPVPLQPSAVSQVIERTADQRLGRAVVIGCALGVVGMTALVFGMGMIAGFGAGASLGLGLFCAFWGGLGFGSMFASVLVAVREERREHEAGPDAPISTGLWF
jgi:hypothetical protein